MKANSRTRGLWLCVLAAALAGSVGGARGDILELKNGKKLRARKITYVKSKKEYMVYTEEGASLPVPADQVADVAVAKPANFDAAVDRIKAGDYEKAVPFLEGVAEEMLGLKWDLIAWRWLGEAYKAQGQAEKAITAVEKATAELDPRSIPVELNRLYWSALLEARQNDKLEAKLTTAIREGTRDTAACAQTVRGDLFLAKGLKTEALVDGYLRTVWLFKDVPGAQPEALAKTAAVMDELRDPRADEFRKMLLENYPQSEYAQELKQKM